MKIEPSKQIVSHTKESLLVHGMTWDNLKTLIVRMYSKGLEKPEIENLLCLKPGTITKLINEDAEFKSRVELAKAEPNHQVEEALFRRALGYFTREITTEFGKPVKVVEKQVHPDTSAAIFWLKNRDPKRWKDVSHLEFSLRDRMDRAHRALSEGMYENGEIVED